MSSASSSVPIVDVSWLSGHLSDAATLVVDVRPYSHYQAAHIPGSISLDVASLRLPASDEQTIAAWTTYLQKGLRAAGITGAQRVIFYEDISGSLAAFGVWLLDVAGLENGALLDGGMRAWRAEGQQTSSQAVRPEPSTVEVTVNRQALATADEILQDLQTGKPPAQLVDTRGTGEYLSGTIPGSTHLEWTNHLDPASGKLKDREALRALYSGAGVTPDRPAITYCAGGFRAAHTYVVLKSLGFPTVSSYAPSWAEWSQRADAPVESPS